MPVLATTAVSMKKIIIRGESLRKMNISRRENNRRIDEKVSKTIPEISFRSNNGNKLFLINDT